MVTLWKHVWISAELRGGARRIKRRLAGSTCQGIAFCLPETSRSIGTPQIISQILIFKQFRRTFFFFQNENISRIRGKNRVSFWVSPPNPEPADFLGFSFWKLKFRFKTRMNRAQDLVYQCGQRSDMNCPLHVPTAVPVPGHTQEYDKQSTPRTTSS